MSGWVILIAGLVLGNVVYLVLTLVMAGVLGLRPPLATLGLFWRPLRFRLGGTDIQLGPLALSAGVTVDVPGEAADKIVARPLTRALLAVFAFVVLLLAGLAVGGDGAMVGFVAALKAYVTLPLHIGTGLNVAAPLEGIAAHQGTLGAVAIVVAGMAAINLVPLPPFAGFTFVSDIYHALRGRPMPDALVQGLLKLNALWLLVLAVTLVVRHLGG